MPMIGFLRITSAVASRHLVAAFHQGLKQTGFIEGQNVGIEYRWGDGEDNRLPELAADLVRRRVAVIVGHSAAHRRQGREYDADCFRGRQRSRRIWPGGQSQSAWWQRHWRDLFHHRPGGQAARAAARIGSRRSVVGVLVDPTCRNTTSSARRGGRRKSHRPTNPGHEGRTTTTSMPLSRHGPGWCWCAARR